MTKIKEMTVYDLSEVTQDDALRIILRMQFAASYEDRVRCVEDAIDKICRDFAETRSHRKDRDEDGLTIDVVSALRFMVFDAGHDNDMSGHVDVVVRGRDGFLWMAEAKIHKDYAWLLKGFRQLTTRYASGVPGQTSGGMIIYCKIADTLHMMKTWKDFLAANETLEVCEFETSNPLVFRSVHKIPASGLSYSVRHTPIVLFHKPADK